jgi:pimeloyl-ACP methyl ester carboxylesterase
VAQWLAIDHPECVATLILSGSGPGTSYDGQFYERGVPFDTIVELIEKGSEKYMRDHVAGDFMFSPEFVQNNPEVIKRFEEASLNHPTSMRPYLRHVIARQEHETRHLLHKIDCSTLVICGAGDRTEGGTGDHVQSSRRPILFLSIFLNATRSRLARLRRVLTSSLFVLCVGRFHQ